PTIAPQKVAFSGITAEGINTIVTLDVTNPNRVDLAGRSVSADVSLDAKPLDHLDVSHEVTLPAEKTTRLEVPLALKWTDLSTVPSLAAQNRDFPYQVDGTLELGGDLLHVGVPFHLTGSLTHAELVRAAASSIPRITLPGLH